MRLCLSEFGADESSRLILMAQDCKLSTPTLNILLLLFLNTNMYLSLHLRLL